METEPKRIKVSEKRQITIPLKFYELLNIQSEVEIFVKDNALVIRPVHEEEDTFSTAILRELMEQGYDGEELIEEFKKAHRDTRTALRRLRRETAMKVKESRRKIREGTYKSEFDEIFADADD